MPLSTIRILYELGIALLFLVVAVRSWRTRGGAVTARELVFGFVLSQSVELLAVQYGRYRYPDWLVYFPPHPAWVPLGVGLGWAALVPTGARGSARLGSSPSRRSSSRMSCDGVLGSDFGKAHTGMTRTTFDSHAAR